MSNSVCFSAGIQRAENMYSNRYVAADVILPCDLFACFVSCIQQPHFVRAFQALIYIKDPVNHRRRLPLAARKYFDSDKGTTSRLGCIQNMASAACRRRLLEAHLWQLDTVCPPQRRRRMSTYVGCAVASSTHWFTRIPGTHPSCTKIPQRRSMEQDVCS